MGVFALKRNEKLLKIGIVRHFKVNLSYPKSKRVSAEEVMEWFRQYDRADIVMQDPDLGETEWEICYSSDMPRAVRTAKRLFAGDVLESAVLRELPLPVLSGRIRLPFLWWAVAVKMKQLTNRESKAKIRQARERFCEWLATLDESGHENVLIVSHAAFMMEMSRVLRKQGFRGPTLGYAKNGKLYMFEK